MLLFLFLLVLFCSPTLADSGSVIFVNEGKLFIDETENANSATLYISDGVRVVSGNTNVTLNGTMKIGGSFYQDSETNVFEVDEDGISTSSGSVYFMTDKKTRRSISSSDVLTFDRANYYIAFPHIRIDTNDTIGIPARMGIDVASVHVGEDKRGIFILHSDTTSGNTQVHDASLRITGTNSFSEELVDAGSVIIERMMRVYRNGMQLFAFATPFKNTQLSGYFAGNWIRKPEKDPYSHTTYVLGNKPSQSVPSEIDTDQYVIDPLEKLEPAQAYLIKPRSAGFNYQDMINTGGLSVTGSESSLYDQDKFVFNGQVYSLPPYQEQVFADDVLFNYTFRSETPATKTLNWLIGNSYTSPVSTRLLAEKMGANYMTFAPYIYIFPAGSTSYQPLIISEDMNGINVTDYDEIPAMSVFMIRVSRSQPGGVIPAGTTFSIGKEVLEHGNASHNLRSAEDVKEDIIFRVTSSGNPHVYDLTAIGFREDASESSDPYDIAKIYTSANDGFQLYSLSSAGSRLSSNGIPRNVKSVLMGFKPESETKTYSLEVKGAGNLSTGGLWIEDLLTNRTADLFENPVFTFTGQTGDPENRFKIYFSDPTSIDETKDTDLLIYAANDQVFISGLNA